MQLTFVNTKAWWLAAGTRAARTALTMAVSYVLVGGVSQIQWLAVSSAAAFGVVTSFLTSLFNLPEMDSTTSKWEALVSRVLKTFAQSVLAMIPTTAVFLGDVNWVKVVDTSASAALGSLILGLVSVLPETVTLPTPQLPAVAAPAPAAVTPTVVTPSATVSVAPSMTPLTTTLTPVPNTTTLFTEGGTVSTTTPFTEGGMTTSAQ